MSKLINKCKFSGLKAIILATSMGFMALGFAGQASAGVIDASASAFGIDVNLSTVTVLGNVITFGLETTKLAVGANAADANMFMISLNPLLSGDLFSTSASTSFVPSAAGSANAASTISNLALVLATINTSLSADLIASTAELDKAANQTVTATGTTTLVGANLSVLGNVISLAAAPAPNTVVFNAGGIFVVLNEQVFNNTPNGPACIPLCTDNFFTSAIRISLTNVNLVGVGVVNGNIIVANSAVSLTKDVQAANVAEPATLMLFGLGLLGVFFLYRRRVTVGGMQPSLIPY